ncbi:MAG: hypothetical protein KatS3mg054_0862 [Chloroflexus sp.]|nr:MAG: hypothetical protein KatS3mg054_0862 [Chloroflexus sp.]GIV92096.1 MAG: hypothetical protein KatS3mg056_0805 [Chloroflexus sp.]
MLPHQPCFVPGAYHAVDPAGHTHCCRCRQGKEHLARALNVHWRPSSVLSRTGLVALPARHARVATFGVRQPCCRTSRASCQVRITLLTLPAARIAADAGKVKSISHEH